MNLPFKINLDNKVVVITGAGGVICSHLAKALALLLLSQQVSNQNYKKLNQKE